MVIGDLRKVLLFSTQLQNNTASFVNTSDKTLHIRKTILKLDIVGTLVPDDEAAVSLDENPSSQQQINDSRSHISGVAIKLNTGTVATGGQKDREVLSFNRNDLTLRPDEGLFLNSVDRVGAPTVDISCQIFYED